MTVTPPIITAGANALATTAAMPGAGSITNTAATGATTGTSTVASAGEAVVSLGSITGTTVAASTLEASSGAMVMATTNSMSATPPIITTAGSNASASTAAMGSINNTAATGSTTGTSTVASAGEEPAITTTIDYLAKSNPPKEGQASDGELGEDTPSAKLDPNLKKNKAEATKRKGTGLIEKYMSDNNLKESDEGGGGDCGPRCAAAGLFRDSERFPEVREAVHSFQRSDAGTALLIPLFNSEKERKAYVSKMGQVRSCSNTACVPSFYY